MSEKVRAHVFIQGRVQGVFFRSSTQDVAEPNHITGWVRNLRDGRVEALFEGEKEDVEEAVEWCHSGPPGAYVTNVEVTWKQASDEFASFQIRHTG